MNGSNACAFKITFVTKVSQEDWVHVYYGKLPYEMVFCISATPGQKNDFFRRRFHGTICDQTTATVDVTQA